MNPQDKPREAMTQQRLQDEHLQETMLSRSEAEVGASQEDSLREEARQRMVEQRKQEEHVQETMLNRTATETGIASQVKRVTSSGRES
jgi:hypothetical protein